MNNISRTMSDKENDMTLLWSKWQVMTSVQNDKWCKSEIQFLCCSILLLAAILQSGVGACSTPLTCITAVTTVTAGTAVAGVSAVIDAKAVRGVTHLVDIEAVSGGCAPQVEGHSCHPGEVTHIKHCRQVPPAFTLGTMSI